MKNIFNLSALITAAIVTFTSCKKEGTLNANLDIIDKNIIVKTNVDTWLDNNFLNPYNIETKFRFDRYELDLGKNITPPMESQVIPAMEMVRDVWIKPFEAVGGATFIKRISPKQFILAGSAEFNVDGTITLGTAEGGRKIVLYVINSFDKTNLASVKQMIQVIQHEYTHILNQTVDYQTDYQTISRGGYVANWTQETLASARNLGFITQYARAAPEEDFAEMSSNMLMLGRVVSNSIINNSPADGAVKLRKKEQMVVDYFKSAFAIDFYALQTEVQNALNKISAPVLSKMIGPNIGYTSLYAAPSTIASQSVEFRTLWSQAARTMLTNGFTLRDFRMNFKADNIMTLTYSFSSGATVYTASADYDYNISGDGTLSLSLGEQPDEVAYGNMDFINNWMAPVNRYFQNNQFKIDWFDKTPGKIGIPGSIGGFYKSTDATSYFYGTLGS